MVCVANVTKQLTSPSINYTMLVIILVTSALYIETLRIKLFCRINVI